MANDVIPQSVATLLSEILTAWRDRTARRAASNAGGLAFWRDGMLEQLQKIAEGDADEKTFVLLAKNFEQTNVRVSRLVGKLKRARDELSPGRIAEQIDVVLNHDLFGKRKMRDQIRRIIQRHKANEDVKSDAEAVFHATRTLNSELERLHRIVSS
jgi:hypothetical protein